VDERKRPRLLRRRLVYQGRYIDVRVDDLALPDGLEVVREVVDHPGAVVIAALDDDLRVAMARQYRHPLEDEILELPAGVLDPGETPAKAAERELKEEAGLEAVRVEYLGSFFSSPGFLHEELHAFMARDLAAVEATPDDDEDIEIVWHDLASTLRRPETLRDAKTLATLLLVEARLRQEGRLP